MSGAAFLLRATPHEDANIVLQINETSSLPLTVRGLSQSSLSFGLSANAINSLAIK